jgi:hypothetical protein
MTRALGALLASFVSLAAACGNSTPATVGTGGPDGAADASSAPTDGSSTPPANDASDASKTNNDAGPPSDAGTPPSDATLPRDAAAGDADDDAAPSQALAIPMYVDPSAPDWAQETAAAKTVSLLVANPNSGPGASADAAYTQAIATAHAAKQTIVGYVHTSYSARAIADVEADIDSWYSFYPAIDGIFSDETATDPSDVAPYYAPLYAYVKAKAGARLVIINPGTPPDESYMTASDIVVSFEDTYANYVNAQTPAWVTTYPRSRFWHLVLSTAQADMANAVTLARSRNVGLIYATDQGPATAYSQLVTGAYWQAELDAVSAP